MIDFGLVAAICGRVVPYITYVFATGVLLLCLPCWRRVSVLIPRLGFLVELAFYLLHVISILPLDEVVQLGIAVCRCPVIDIESAVFILCRLASEDDIIIKAFLTFLYGGRVLGIHPQVAQSVRRYWLRDEHTHLGISQIDCLLCHPQSCKLRLVGNLHP